VSRTNRVSTVANVTVLTTSSSANVPVAAGPYAVPSVLTSIRYWPIRPFALSAGGR
jgi:hypothetical protein